MIPVPAGVRVWLASGVTAMRKGMNSLTTMVQGGLGRDPHGGDLFVFRGRAGHSVVNTEVKRARSAEVKFPSFDPVVSRYT